ncbi:flagellar hook-basal body complex protein [bacterium D16-76]|nr:flagellar hook-basal body complex protein [bacterium D16-76]
MTGAMYSAVAGLRAHMNALNVIGNNISNVNTNAYKASRYTFLESMYSNMRNGSNGTVQSGGNNPSQVGYGASIGTIDLDMSTKNFTPTGINGDVMINGNGFFIVGDKGQSFNSMSDIKNMLLTRHGDLGFDSQGYMVDGNKKVVYGYLATERMVNKGTDEEPVWTTEYEGQPILTDFRMPMLVQKECYVYLNTKTGEQIIWDHKPTKDELNALDVPDSDKTDEIGADGKPTGQKVFNENLIIKKEKGDALYPSYKRTPARDENGQVIADKFDVEFTDANTSTVLGAGNATGAKLEDFVGDARALVDSISIDDGSGRVTATTTTGKVVVVGYLAIAKCDNPNGVTHVDGHYYQALEGAGNVYATSIKGAVQNSHGPVMKDDPNNPGQQIVDKPASMGYDETTGKIPGEISGILSSGATTLISGGLESSGTDLATEISNMILVQRGYQANTRIVTVTDTMLEELVNMKR